MNNGKPKHDGTQLAGHAPANDMHPQAQPQLNDKHGREMYLKLGAMLALSFISMYLLMYAMVDRLPNVLMNYNQAYMAGMMTAPMLVFELVLMGRMYPRKGLNGILIATGCVTLLILWLATRGQVLIGDRQFLRSMIPHHAGAILMCNEASISDPDIAELCRSIRASQQEEIDLMQAMLLEMDAVDPQGN